MITFICYLGLVALIALIFKWMMTDSTGVVPFRLTRGDWLLLILSLGCPVTWLVLGVVGLIWAANRIDNRR